MKRVYATIVLMLVCGLALHAQQREVLRNTDIVEMVNAHLGSDVIVLKIGASNTHFDTSADALAALKAAGVPDAVIAEMIKAGAKTAGAAASPRTPAAPRSDATATDGMKATVYVYRPGKFMGKGLEPSVFLDEQKILDMDNGRYFTLHLDAGRHILRSNEKNSEIDQTWEAGKSYYVKMTIATGMWKGHGQLGMVTEKLAEKEMEQMRPLDSDNVEPEYKAVVDLKPIK